MSAIAKHIAAILLISGVVAVVANTVHPRRIPWTQSWSNHVEARARKAGINVLPLSVALKLYAEDAAYFVDARPFDEFQKGHIVDALSIPVSVIHESPEELFALADFERTVVIYCRDRNCDDGLVLATELTKLGATNHVLYIDGFEMWEKHEGPVAR